MHPWTESDIIANGTRLHYYRTGGPKPPLVLTHGITDDGLCWTPVAEVLSGQYDVIMVDSRGHGKSEAPDDGYNQVIMATELTGLVAGLALENPVVMGHSMGAMTALVLASLTPDLPRAIILEDPPAFWNPDLDFSKDEDIRAGMRLSMMEHKRRTRDDLLAFCRTRHPDWSEAEIEPWVDSKHRFSPKITKIINPQETVSVDIPSVVSRITCPVLLITADPEKGAILTDDDVNSLRVSVPHLKMVHISDAGHSIRREQFSRYMDVVQNFLSRLSG